jgi:hypothetical protein
MAGAECTGFDAGTESGFIARKLSSRRNQAFRFYCER